MRIENEKIEKWLIRVERITKLIAVISMVLFMISGFSFSGLLGMVSTFVKQGVGLVITVNLLVTVFLTVLSIHALDKNSWKRQMPDDLNQNQTALIIHFFRVWYKKKITINVAAHIVLIGIYCFAGAEFEGDKLALFISCYAIFSYWVSILCQEWIGWITFIEPWKEYEKYFVMPSIDMSSCVKHKDKY